MLPSFLLPDRARRRRVLGPLEAASDRGRAALPPSAPRRPRRPRNCRQARRQRARQAHARALERELCAIREQVARLERQRALLASAALSVRANADGYALAQVRQFYALFGRGYRPETRPAESAAAARFLRALMTPDVVCAEFRGVDTFLQQYHVCTVGHQSMHVQLHEALVVGHEAVHASGGGEHGESEPGEVVQVRANAVARFRVSRETLRRFFPRVAGDEALAQRLLGKEYVLQYDKVFHLRGGRVFQHESRVDFVSSLLTMAQDPCVAAALLEASVMTKHGHLQVKDAQVAEDRHELQYAVLAQ